VKHMKFVWRAVALLVVAAMLGALLTACAAPAPSTKATEAPPAAAETTAPESPSGEVVTLTMWGNHPEWKDRVLPIVAAFETEHPNIKIKLDQKPTDQYAVALNTALAGGDAPDLIGFYPGPALAEAANAGQILDLTGKIDVDRLTVSGRDASKVGDKVYGVPAMGTYTVGLFYHKKMFEDLGLTPPTTWEELKEVSEKLKAAGITPMIMPAKDAVIPFFFYIMAVDSILGPEGYQKLIKGEVKLTDEQQLQAVQLLKDMAQYFQEGYLSTSYAEGKALFAREQGAMLIGGSADYSGYQEVNPKVNVGVVAFPSPASVGKPATTSGMELVYAANSKTKHPEEAATFLNWFTSDKAGQMVADSITLTTVKGIVPANNPVLAEMVRAATNDVRVWYEIPATGGVLDVFGTHGQKLFTGDLSVDEFAKLVQDSIKPAQ